MRAIVLTGLVAAQALGTLRVTVVDPSGAVIVGARVELVAADGSALSLATNGNGEALFERIDPSRYGLRVQSPGFAPYDARDVRLRSGENRRVVKLAIAKLTEVVRVERDPRERASDPHGDMFTAVLGPDQIDQLPDDPDEMERVLRDMAGPGASIRVNGFRSNRLPPKDQIQQVRFRRNALAAESHDVGVVSVDIVTRPGGDNWRGSTLAGVRSSALNARNALAPRKEDERYQRYSLSLNGPLWSKHTSASLAVDATTAMDTRTIVATLPSGPFVDASRQPLGGHNVSARVEHALSPARVLRAEVDYGRGRVEGLGVGDFNLPERGYAQRTGGRGVRVSAVGPLGPSVYNELRVQSRSDTAAFAPATVSPAILVLSAFSAGGAQIHGSRRSRQLELSDDIDWAKGPHALRAGLLLETVRTSTDVARNAGGTFTFASLDAFRASKPTTFSRNVGDPHAGVEITQVGAYIQDDYRWKKNVTLSAGVRQEHQSTIGGWPVGPRAAFVWAPFSSGRTSVRAGAGLFFDWFDAQSYEQAVQLDGSRQHIETVVAPDFPRAADDLHAIALPPGRARIAASVRQPRLRQLMAAVEQRVAADVRISATVTSRRGWHLLRGLNVNAPVGGVRPDQSSGPVIEIGSTARSRLESLSIQTTYNPTARPLFASATYTWSRSTNDADGPAALPADARDLASEMGPAPDDARHRFNALVSAPIVGRLRFGASARAQSALPYNVTTGRDDNGDTISNDRPAGISRNAARGAMQADVAARLSWSIGFLRKPSTAGTPGVMARSKGDGDALAAMGSSLDLTKRFNLELYAQSFNLLNRTNPTTYSGVVTSPMFGHAVAAAPPRRFELGARLRF